MFNSEDIIGDIVLISFNNKDFLSDIGINAMSGHFLVKGHDHLGLWLQHPGIFIKQEKEKSQSKTPKPIKINKDKLINGVFLVMWNNINTIMHYPDRDGYDFPSEFDKNIGFKKGD